MPHWAAAFACLTSDSALRHSLLSHVSTVICSGSFQRIALPAGGQAQHAAQARVIDEQVVALAEKGLSSVAGRGDDAGESAFLTFTEDALRSVATRAIARKTGARGLRSIMEAILLSTMFDLPGLDGVEEVVINREVAESRANPLYLYGKERAETSA